MCTLFSLISDHHGILFILLGEGQHPKDHFNMGKDNSEDMASFASVALSGNSTTAFSPSRESLSDHSPITQHSESENRAVCASSRARRTVLSDDIEIHDTVSVDRSVTNEHDGPSQLERISCDKQSKSCGRCSVTQSCEHEDSSGVDSIPTGYKLSGKILNRNVRQLKRKYRKRAKSPFLKKPKVGNNATEGDEFGSEESKGWSVRSVCSESEPLPLIHQEKHKHDTDDEHELVKATHAKLQKRLVSCKILVHCFHGIFVKVKYVFYLLSDVTSSAIVPNVPQMSTIIC